jgi:hypothetical protein
MGDGFLQADLPEMGVSMRLISMSMYGSDKKYIQGAIENARLAPEIYPGWKLRIYHDGQHDVRDLEALGCECVDMGPSLEHSGMIWRFLPAWEPDIDRVICRDTDSRLCRREAVAVAEWIESGMPAHAMHDHPHHAAYPLFGGMWGIQGGILSESSHTICRDMMRDRLPRVGDMKYLRHIVYPQIKGFCLHHSSVDITWQPKKIFPTNDRDLGFVGQVIEI